jgi:hypothetical protein
MFALRQYPDFQNHRRPHHRPVPSMPTTNLTPPPQGLSEKSDAGSLAWQFGTPGKQRANWLLASAGICDGESD